MNYKYIYSRAFANHVQPERFDGSGVNQARRFKTPITNREKYTVEISGVLFFPFNPIWRINQHHS